ncbi:YbaM family protein [Enterobacteriaceae bacterium LUAb1]
MSLVTAPDEVKLAVDLIQLLEDNQVPVEVVLAALQLVQRDYEQKAAQQKKSYCSLSSAGL